MPLPLPDTSARGTDEPRGAIDPSTLPARLRDRLEHELAREDSGMPPLRGWLIAVSVLATVGIILVLMQRFGAIDVPILRGPAGTRASGAGSEGPEATPPSAATSADPSAAVLDSLRRQAEGAPEPSAPVRAAATRRPATQPARSRVTSDPRETGGADTPVPAPTTKPAATTPAATTPAATSGAATRPAANGSTTQRTAGSKPPTAAPSPSASAFGVGVASYLDEGRANVERDRIAAETMLPAIIVPYEDAGTTMYRVVLGRWTSAGEAERSANDLMEKGAINEARVMRLPRR